MSAQAIDNTNDNYGNHLWQLVLNDLHQHYGQNPYNSWFIKINFHDLQNNNIILTASTNFIRDWVIGNYYHNIIKFFKNYDSNISIIEIITIKSTPLHSISTYPISVESNLAIIKKDNQIDYDCFNSYCDPRFTFENFIVDSSNKLAYSAAMSVAKSNEAVSFCNPLFIYGGVGLGKTHLMHAVASYTKINNPTRKVLYISAEKFMYQFVKALRCKDVISFKEKLRAVDVLMIDDVQFICGKESTQEEFFHTFNALTESNSQIILSCDRAPCELHDMEERIKSRLGQGLGADVSATTYNLRLNILKAKSQQLNVNVKDDILEFLATKISTNVRELEGALNKIVAHSNLTNNDIDLKMAHQIFKTYIKPKVDNVTIDYIQKLVAKKYELEVHDMSSARRLKIFSRPRQIAMYLSKNLTVQSLTNIGRQFGNKDHTTVMHAVKKIEHLYLNSYEFKIEIDSLAKSIRN